MWKRILSAVLLVVVLAAMGLTSPGCGNEPATSREDHEEVNKTEVKERNLRVD